MKNFINIFYAPATKIILCVCMENYIVTSTAQSIAGQEFLDFDVKAVILDGDGSMAKLVLVIEGSELILEQLEFPQHCRINFLRKVTKTL
jgi:hypothetical protein